jgi:hypothetical protein
MVWCGPLNFTDDPYTVDCPCKKCVRGSRCTVMTLWIEQYELRKVLTKQDKEWLHSHGWV